MKLSGIYEGAARLKECLFGAAKKDNAGMIGYNHFVQLYNQNGIVDFSLSLEDGHDVLGFRAPISLARMDGPVKIWDSGTLDKHTDFVRLERAFGKNLLVQMDEADEAYFLLSTMRGHKTCAVIGLNDGKSFSVKWEPDQMLRTLVARKDKDKVLHFAR